MKAIEALKSHTHAERSFKTHKGFYREEIIYSGHDGKKAWYYLYKPKNKLLKDYNPRKLSVSPDLLESVGWEPCGQIRRVANAL